MKKIFVSIAALAMLATPLGLAASAPAMADGFKSCLTKTISGDDIPTDRLASFCSYGSIYTTEKAPGRCAGTGGTFLGFDDEGGNICFPS